MIHHIDCLEFMRGMVERGERVDCIITDPPYLYLNHKLDRKFNESEFFELASKITDRIAFFGRGDSFYRWNLLCADFGFEFKEEIVWDKRKTSSPVTPIGRCHELINVRMKKGSCIKKVRIPYSKSIKENNNLGRALADIAQIKTALKDTRFLAFINRGERTMQKRIEKHKVTVRPNSLQTETLRSIRTLEKLEVGLILKSIIGEPVENMKMEHPTQKPINLLRKLVLLMSDKGELVFDPFMGSGSTGVASLIEGRKFVGCEIDSEYFEIAKRRISETDKTLRQSLFYGID